MKKLFWLLGSAVLVVLAVIIIRTAGHTPAPATDTAAVTIDLDQTRLATHLSQAITFRTVSFQASENQEPEEFTGFIDWVKHTYPEVNQEAELTLLNRTMLYRWPGADASLKPVLITGHYDVVPVIPGSESRWSYPPFAGTVAEGVIWGRGALDDKSGVVGILEAVTYLLREGYKPTRTIYLSFGHDEELGGPEGAAAVAAYLAQNNVQLAWSLDEGSFVLGEVFPGLDTLVAAINVAEKGSVTLDLVATAAGGHSSMPPKDNAVGALAAAIVKLEKNPVPGGLEGLSAQMFHEISRHLPFGMRMLFANQWLFGPLIDRQLSEVATTNAMLRTTTAPTIVSGGVKTNVLPTEAVATINFRIHPRDTPESVQAYVEGLVANDAVSVRTRGGSKASGVSDWDAPGFHAIAGSMREIYGSIAVAPGLMVAGSDSRHYGKVADNAYRFNPFVVMQKDIAGFHGTDEQISVEAFAQGVRGYIQIIRHGSGAGSL